MCGTLQTANTLVCLLYSGIKKSALKYPVVKRFPGVKHVRDLLEPRGINADASNRGIWFKVGNMTTISYPVIGSLSQVEDVRSMEKYINLSTVFRGRV